MKITPQQLHIPVLLDVVLDLLAPKAGEHYLDLTAGYGGHAQAVVARIGSGKFATLVDRDQFAINYLQENFTSNKPRIIKSDFESAVKNFAKAGEKFDMILLDLGVSSPQLDFAERGFSFAKSAKLDMRMDQTQTLTAAEIVNHYSEKKLIKILEEYGEETPRMASRIARAIVLRRAKEKFATTDDLAEVVRIAIAKADHGKFHKIHPATKTFQALRIETNDELGQLRETLPILPKILNDGGRLAILSFHSLEDRIMKSFLRDYDFANDYENELHILTKHPITGADDDNNPRARSSKLRAAVKINKTERSSR